MFPGKSKNRISSEQHPRRGSERLTLSNIAQGESMETNQTNPDAVVESDNTLTRSRISNLCTHSQPLNGGCSAHYSANPSPIFAIQGDISMILPKFIMCMFSANEFYM